MLDAERYRLQAGDCPVRDVDGRARSLRNRLKTSARCAVMTVLA